jgi:hypothetical protein
MNVKLVRHLNYADLPGIEKIFFENTDAVQERKKKRNQFDESQREKLSHLTALWFDAMNKWYLNPNDKEHILLGLEDQGTLLAYVGIRLDLPGEYSDGWVVSWLKADPSVNLIKNGGMRMLWLEMFRYAESVGKIRWHTITEKARHRAFDAFGKKLVPEIDSRYDYYTLCEVTPGTRPTDDWVFAMMGRTIQDKSTYLVRTGILKPEFRINK